MMTQATSLSRETEELLTLKERYIPAVYQQHHPIVAVSGEGAWISDSDGRRYLDFAGGIGVLNVGHRHPLVVKAVQEQVDRLMHSGPVMLHDGYIKLAARLAETVAPGGGHQVLFLNSRRRGCRERRQGGSSCHRPSGHHRIRGLVPRSHTADLDPQRQGRSLQVTAWRPRSRDLPRGLPEHVQTPRRRCGGGPRRLLPRLARAADPGRGGGR